MCKSSNGAPSFHSIGQLTVCRQFWWRSFIGWPELSMNGTRLFSNVPSMRPTLVSRMDLIYLPHRFKQTGVRDGFPALYTRQAKWICICVCGIGGPGGTDGRIWQSSETMPSFKNRHPHSWPCSLRLEKPEKATMASPFPHRSQAYF